MKELLDLVRPDQTITIVPDEFLEALPFEALVMAHPESSEKASGPYGTYPKGIRYVGDHYAISYYYSATSLAVIRDLKRPNAYDRTLLVLADPSFSKSDVGGDLGAVNTIDYGSKLRQMSLQSDWQRLRGQFLQLPTTSELARRLTALFPENDLLIGSQASEHELRRRFGKHYRYVVFATHGILAKEIPYIQEPALVLSQTVPNPADKNDDGFLTMTEVMKLDSPADLVALTACNTGIGLNVSGEGVMSMGRAFQYAGANSVLVSLWSVEDQSTILLTERFLTYLKQGENKLKALGLARTDLRNSGYEHPFYWAPFILVGER